MLMTKIKVIWMAQWCWKMCNEREIIINNEFLLFYHNRKLLYGTKLWFSQNWYPFNERFQAKLPMFDFTGDHE